MESTVSVVVVVVVIIIIITFVVWWLKVMSACVERAMKRSMVKLDHVFIDVFL